jgi:hypothetical protein
MVAVADFIVRGADLSEDGVYRWTLTRRWSEKPRDVWIMLNPSTADAEVDDATIRRCIGFSRKFGAGGMTVVNLFAYRATDPARLRTEGIDPVGDRNDGVIARCAHLARPLGGRVICAWGSHALGVNRGRHVRDLIGSPLFCLGTTRGGHPRHPLYVPGKTELVPYTG